MESRTKNRKTRDQVARMVARAFVGTELAAGEDAVQELKEGWFNAAYSVQLADGREVVLKIAPLPTADVMTYEQQIMTTEVAAMRQVRANPAIPVPAIYYFDQSLEVCDSAFFFMERLTGENYEHVKASLAPAMRTQIDRQIGGIIRAINEFTGPYFGYEGNPALRGATWPDAFVKILDSVLDDARRKQADFFGHSIADIRSAALKHAPALAAVTTPQLVHWDAWDLNFFVQDGQVTGILDFERALWADPLMEAQFRALAWGGVSESMRGYGKTTFTADEEARCQLYTLHLALVMKTECYYRHYESDFVSDLAHRLLEPALAWLLAH